MGDTYGALQIPPATTGGSFPPVQAAGDPLLGYVADFLKTILTATATTAWQQVAPNVPAVKAVILDSPANTPFDEGKLPALYVFRDDGVADQPQEWLACDYRYAAGTVRAYWVFPLGSQEQRSIRSTIATAFDRVIDAAIEAGRDPAWVVPGDPDGQAATLGSVLATFAGWDVFYRRRTRSQDLQIQMLDGKTRKYPMVAIEFHCEELLKRDIASMGAPNDEIDVTIEIPDEGTGLGPLDVDDAHYT